MAGIPDIPDLSGSLTSSDQSVKLVINKMPSQDSLGEVTLNGNELYLVPKTTQPIQIYSVGTTAPSNTNLLWIDTNSGTPLLKYYDGSNWINVGAVWS